MLLILLFSASLAGSAVCEDYADATCGYGVTQTKDARWDVGIMRVRDNITKERPLNISYMPPPGKDNLWIYLD